MKAKRRQVAFLLSAALIGGLLCGVALAGNPHGQATTTSSDNSAGVKPSNTTQKDQTCTTGGGQGSSATCQSSTSNQADSSKRYGNGKTAAQIANGKGAPSGTPVYGPGNSQPHKICGRDVHAYKGSSNKCPSGTQSNTQNGSTNGSLNTAGTNGTGSTAGTGASASSGNPSSGNGVLGASHTTTGKPVAARAKPAHAVLGTASFTG